MEQISKEKKLDIAERIITAFQKNRNAGYIAFRSLDHLDLDTKAYIMYRVSCFDERLPEDLRQSLFEETGTLFERHRKRIKRNLPVKKLLEMFRDKKSGMVGAAASQLKERFLHLEYKDQIKVMDLFLDCSVSYREWWYRTLRMWREPRYDETLVAHWRKYADMDCLYTIIDVLPGIVAKDLYPEFRNSMTRRESRLFLERFGMEPWAEIDKEWVRSLSSHTYYYIKGMSYTHSPLPASECAELFYEYLQEGFSEYSEDELWELNEVFEDEYRNTPPLCYHFNGIKLPSYGCGTQYVEAFLKLFAKMGHYDLVTGICSWGDSVNRLLPYVDAENASDKEKKKISRERFLTYIRLLRENMPNNFEGIADYPACDLDTVIDEYEFVRLQSDPVMSILTGKLDLTPF